MFRFSLKTLLSLTLLSSVAMWSLIHPSLSIATVVALGSLVSVALAFSLALALRRYVLGSITVLCFAYLLLADGGLVPTGERFLPTEKILAKSSSHQTMIESGVKGKRITSLSQFLWSSWRERSRASEQPEQTRDPDTRSQRVPNVVIDDSSIVIELPKFAPVTASVTVSKRESPENMPFFILGHSWFVLTVIAISTVVLSSRDDSV